MFTDLKSIWCDGIPGSANDDAVRDMLIYSVTSLRNHGIIESQLLLTKEEQHYVWRFSSDHLLAQRRKKLRDRWFQPAIKFICHDNSDMSQLAAAWLKHVRIMNILLLASTHCELKRGYIFRCQEDRFG